MIPCGLVYYIPWLCCCTLTYVLKSANVNPRLCFSVPVHASYAFTFTKKIDNTLNVMSKYNNTTLDFILTTYLLRYIFLSPIYTMEWQCILSAL